MIRKLKLAMKTETIRRLRTAEYQLVHGGSPKLSAGGMECSAAVTVCCSHWCHP